MSFERPTFYEHFSQVPLAAFKARWPNFSPEELASKDRPPNQRRPGAVLIDPAALDKLQALRTRLGKPLVITSAYRTPEHNRQVRGAPNSFHVQGKAYDVSMLNHNPGEFERAAVAVGFRGIGHYPASNFMHIDDRATANVVRFKGTGANNRWFDTTPVANGGEAFTPPAIPTTGDGLKETAIQLAPVVAPVLTGGAAVAQGDGPVQWALAIIAVVGFIGAVIWLVRRNKRGVIYEDA